MRLYRNRDFMLLQSGQLLSAFGGAFTTVAYPLLVLSITHSPAKAGLVSFARFLPSPLLGLVAGVVADRVDRKRVMIAADGVRVVAVGGLAALVAFDPMFWPIPLLAFVEGAGESFFGACQNTALRAVVPTEQLADAVSVQTGRMATVGLVGPPVGGALFGLARALPFVADAASYAFSFISLALIRTPFQEPREPAQRARIRTQLMEGLRFIWRQPFIRVTSFFFLIGNFAIPGLLFVLVVLARRHGLSGGEIGLLLGTFSAALLVGTMLSRFVRRHLGVPAIVRLEQYCACAVVAFVAVPSVYVLLAGLLPIAVAIPFTDSVVISRRLELTPDALLGRVEAARSTIARGAAPLGPLTAGLLLTASSPRVTVAVFSAFFVVLAVWASVSSALRQ
ncbi:MAG TPA: MFS transporter [Gaiellaceae bacterium]|nr:MFS transporter [Gaiellaceae bacterium]